MVTYEIYKYNPKIDGYGEWVEGTSVKYGRATERTMKKNALVCLERSEEAKTGKYVVATLKGTEKQFEDDYWSFIVSDAVVEYNKEKHTLVVLDYMEYRREE